MSRQFLLSGVILTVLMVVAAGCRPQQPAYLFEDGDLSHYVGAATQIEYPDVETASLDDAKGDLPPLTLENSKPKEVWELKLEEAVRIALANGNVIRNLGGVVFGAGGAQGEPSSVTGNPDFVATTYDPARTESDPRFGTEAALAAFDAQLSSSVLWESGITPQNTAGAISQQIRPNPTVADTASFQSQLAKTNATGGTVFLRHNVGYAKDNSPVFNPVTQSGFKEWPSNYTAQLQAEIRQPFLQTAGVSFNRIAGPGAIPGYNNGILIARLRTDVALAEFESAVQRLVSDVEKAYWETYYAYRSLDSVMAGRDSALQTWRQANAKKQTGAKGGEAWAEAQARQQYFIFRGAAETALSNLYSTENHLRYMLGLAATDGRLIRPADEPTTAKVSFDWYEGHCEALVRAVDIRKQKWKIKQRELELIAAKNWLMPRLDGVAKYTWNGLGHTLLDPDNVERNAYGSLATGKFPDWQLGIEFQMPLGFRKEMAGVRSAQLTLARERAVLQEQELELSHQLALTFRDLSDKYVLSETHFNRRIAAQREVDSYQAAWANGAVTIDVVLGAQQRKAEAEVQYYRSLIDYNLSITDMHYKKGSLLEYNGVFLAEGPWPGKAYFDARRRARARDAGMYLDYGFTMPKVMSRGPIEQNAGAEQPPVEGEDGMAAPVPLEQIPTPKPEPAGKASAPHKAEPKASALPALDGAATSTSRRGAAGHKQGTYDLGAMNLAGLTGGNADPQAASAAPQSSVQPASYQPADSSPAGDAKPAGNGWKNTKRSGTTNEPVANLPSAETDQSASGWKRVSR
jgi:outer membrane protein TolC